MSGTVQATATVHKTLGTTATSIANALDSNLALQAELKRLLTEVRSLQVQNRIHAAEVTESLSLCWSNFDHKVKETGDNERDETNSICHNSTTEREGETKQNANNSEKSCIEFYPPLTVNPSKRWTKRFFIDKDGLSPSFYSGSVKSDAPKDSMGEMGLAWTKDEKHRLQEVVNEIQGKWREENKDLTKIMDVANPNPLSCDHQSFFAEVASSLDSSPARSAEECRVAFFTSTDPCIHVAKFSKQESLFILNTVHELSGGDHEQHIDWFELASRFNLKFYPDKSKRRTPWQCFKYFRSSLQKDSSRCPPWTAEEDELLLKYVAAHGPQYVFGGDALSKVCKSLFPLRDPRQVFHRAHHTLVNPNYVQDRWDIDDERKLALLMRAYSDEPYPIRHASSSDHFPHRSQIRVTTKWNRSLNPKVSFKNFTADEDEKLLAAVKEVGFEKTSGITDSVMCMFPDRTRDQIWARWIELAEEHELVSTCERRLIRKTLGKKKGLVGNGDELFSAEDFVVRRKKSKTKS